MKSFRHFSAETIGAATALLQQYDGRATLIAGGTDLLGVLKEDILPASPEAVIDIKTITGLNAVGEENGILRIGASTKLSTVAESPIIQEKYAALALAARSVATPVIRTMATLGGNLCQSVRCWYFRYPHEIGGRILCRRKGGDGCPAAVGDNRYHAIMRIGKCLAVCPSDTAVALAALNAEVRIFGPGGERTVPVADFFTPLGTVLDQTEIVTEVRVPAPPPSSKQAYIKLSLRKPVDFAIVSASSVLTVQDNIVTDARICLGAVAPMPVRAAAAEESLTGNPLSDDMIRAAADAALADSKPLTRNAYKVELAKAAVRKAIQQ